MEKIKYTSPLSPDIDKISERLKSVFNSNWLTNFGTQHNDLERLLDTYLDVKDLQLICNGTIALEIAYKALGLTGNVITTPFTFAATTTSMYWCGIEPRFCDIDKNTLNINPGKIEDLIDEYTSAIVAVHVFGHPCDVVSLKEITDKHNLKLIYDAAHCFGVNYGGQSIMNYGDASTISFHATKVYNTIEGGGIVCNDKEINKKIGYLRNFGFSVGKDNVNVDSVMSPGINGKMSELHAAVGIENLKIVNDELDKRQIVYWEYYDLLKNVDEIKICINYDNHKWKWNYSYMPILVNSSRDEIVEKLGEAGITVKKYFYPLCSDFKYIKKSWDVPVARDISERIICLPIYGDLQNDQIKYICNNLKKLVR